MFPALKTSFDLYLLALTPSQSPAVLRPHILYDQLRYFEYGSIYLDVALSFRASDKFWMALGILEIIEWWLLNVCLLQARLKRRCWIFEAFFLPPQLIIMLVCSWSRSTISIAVGFHAPTAAQKDLPSLPCLTFATLSSFASGCIPRYL
jgi:hypothetical protein